MITKTQALTTQEFHAEFPGGCSQKTGPEGGIKVIQEVWRRNGKTQTWKTRPSEWRIPVKHGLYDYGNIRDYDADKFHTTEDCPLNQENKDAELAWDIGPEEHS